MKKTDEQRFGAWRSGGLEALSCPFSTRFIRRTDIRFTTSPAIEPNACYQQPFYQSNY